MTYYAASAILISVLLLSACVPSTPVVRPPEPSSVVLSTLPAPATVTSLPFASATYRDEINGFELDYPSDWTTSPNAPVGSRGSQAQLLSPGSTPETLAEGGSRLTITLYDWDPKGDLAAFVAQRRSAWDASGIKALDGSVRQLVDGRPASDFFIEAPDGSLAYFLFTTNGEQYLQLSGEGDLGLVEAIASTLRPFKYRPQ